MMILFHLIKVISQTLDTAVGLYHHMDIFNDNSSSHFYTTYYMPGTVLNALLKHFTLIKSHKVVTIIILQISKLKLRDLKQWT